MTVSGPYSAAAQKYRPEAVHTLFVAEAPPSVEDGEEPRYFYIETMSQYDGLFRGIMKALGVPGGLIPESRESKVPLLARFRDAGYFLMDLSEEPLPSHLKEAPGNKRERFLQPQVRGALARIETLRPSRVVLIVAHIYRLLARPLRDRGISVPQRSQINFPSSGQQGQFANEMGLLDLARI
jgi:hypothetical protein